jgi:general secretion pathway protein G
MRTETDRGDFVGIVVERRSGVQGRAGFTLLELMVVLVILALLGSIAAPRVMKYLGKAKTQTAKIQIDALAAAIDSFHLDSERYPTTEEGLGALLERPARLSSWDGPYLKKRDSLLDPWGQPYLYRSPGEKGEFDLYTLGSDRRQGGEGDARDIGNW